ncbi:hypothetical protein LTR01_005078 [Friedmanniomyces endolithicus]|nr:hypothetical protein LTR01_005078 [Friedmanniomyces endolithicus]
MAARADLKDEKVKADYTKAYEELLSFFHDNIIARNRAISASATRSAFPARSYWARVAVSVAWFNFPQRVSEAHFPPILYGPVYEEAYLFQSLPYSPHHPIKMPRQQGQTRGIEQQSALAARVRGGRGTPLLRMGELLMLL